MPRKLTLAQWEAIVRASIKVNSPDDIPKIAAICHEHNCPTWHGAAIFYGTLNQCQCAPCIEARGGRVELRFLR